jgi:hypothetical protein
VAIVLKPGGAEVSIRESWADARRLMLLLLSALEPHALGVVTVATRPDAHGVYSPGRSRDRRAVGRVELRPRSSDQT